MKRVDLPCYDGHNSFYGKAKVEDLGDTKLLYSYGTLVAELIGNDFVRIWNDYSATTMRHVNSFLEHYGHHEGGKAFWDSCPIRKPVHLAA